MNATDRNPAEGNPTGTNPSESNPGERGKPAFRNPLRTFWSRLARPPIVVKAGQLTSTTSRFEIDNAGSYDPLYFRSLSGPGLLQAGADIPLLLTLLQAMKWGRPIRVDDPVSPALVENICRYMEVFSQLHPRYQPVEITATAVPDNQSITPKLDSGPRVGTFFSGGVDSFHTYLTHRDEITDLIFVHGFDIGLEEQQLRRQVSLMGERLSKATGVRFIEIETNARATQKSWGRWTSHAHGVGLASVGRSLAGYLSKLYIPSSFARQEQLPWGTHPELDCLLGDESIQLVHDQTEATRTAKTEFISQFPVALGALRVCYKNTDGAYNCCACEKCLRTMTTLYAVGKLKDASTFPEPISAAAIEALNISSEAVRVLVRDNVRILEKAGLKDSPVAMAWARKLT